MTTFEERNRQLRSQIEESLLPLIDNDYVLWDLPYHNNIGDLLIWEGEVSFLRNIRHKCLDKASKDTCTFPNLSAHTVILLHGGGNFGDVWRDMQDFRLAVMKHYPDNKIIIFPQTVFYDNKALIKKDARIMGQHKNLTICARDRVSYELLKENFSNKILLVPDMAFCIPDMQLKKHRKSTKEKTLFLKRSDKEFKNINYDFQANYPVTISDWPSMEHSDLVQIGMHYAWKFNRLHLSSLTDCYAGFYRKQLIKKGIRFISSYKEVYTTRLHVAILSALLGKTFHIFDNSYGKNRAFYDTWLKGIDNAIFEQ